MKLDVGTCRRLVQTEPIARLATVRPGVDGRPGEVDLVPIVFAVDGDRLVSAVDHKPKTSTRLQRLANIRAEPRVTVLVDHYEADWDRLWWVRLRGEARVVDDGPGQRAAIEQLVGRYPQYESRPPTGPAIEVTITSWLGWSAT